MKKYFILLFMQAWFGCLFAQDTLPKAGLTAPEEIPAVLDSSSQVHSLEEANDLYSKGKFREASQIYESLLSKKGESVTVYFNLGNAYYKSNEIASAILNYERALLLDPGDKDIRFNLEMAKMKTVDKIEPLGDFFLVKWFKSIQNLNSTNEWAWLGIISFLILIICLVIFFFSRKILLKKIGFYVGIACFVLTVSSNIFAYKQKKQLTDRRGAIIFVPTVTIKSSPDKGGTDIVVLHEGTKVTIKRELKGWNEVLLEDGNIGWIEKTMIEII